MIRINLLAVERERTTRRGLIPVAQRVTVGASLILLASVLGIGWWFWSLRQESARVDEDIARAQVEMQQLQSVLAQVRQFEASKAALQQRVSLIEELRRGQSGPVHVIDELSKAIPEYLWLIDVTQKADEFTISGMTTSLSGVSDFVANLAGSPWFKRPIELIDSQVEPSPKTTEPLVKFSIKATFNNPEAPPSPPPAGRGGRGSPAPPAGGRAGS
jgi:type IV pilus assembly protein PilN